MEQTRHKIMHGSAIVLKTAGVHGVRLRHVPDPGSIKVAGITIYTDDDANASFGAPSVGVAQLKFRYELNEEHGPLVWVAGLDGWDSWELSYAEESWEQHFRRTHG